MRKRYYYLVIACLVFAIGWRLKPTNQEYKYPFALCAMFKNEAPWLKEWIDYHHHVLGASHFYLYNNDSDDNYLEVLEPYLESGLVELISWNTSEEHALRGFDETTFVPYQLGAYNDCLKHKALGKAQWVGILDIDEFIVPKEGSQAFFDLLREEARKKTGTLQMYWKIFGTSHVAEIEPGELLTEKLIYRAENAHPWHTNMKSIHRPEAIQLVFVHEAKKLKKGYKRKKLSSDLWSIHHYWTRTDNQLRLKRKPTEESMPFFEAFNTVEDKSIHQYLDVLKESAKPIE